ncbi:carboxypeptidase Taq [Sphaerotilus hippei]|uniref:Metal-dependent carboxypeptidase n=1 Tax=Sphaerotilus hippei TaxID=744406 RepID=A0A318H194_9BURK|nr:carboxypeptidase M32 [Sphaerotilus hippei]PXW96953.1 carboxypeptidase Taq [Sphaerotilus hippei]
MTAPAAPETPAYLELARRHERLHRFEHLESIAGWDQAAMMPPKGQEARAAALAELGALMHGQRTDPALAALLERAGQEPLDDWQRANLREMRREHRLATALPTALVEASTLATSRCEHAWRRLRPANDWAGFLEVFEPVLDLAREQAQRLADHQGLSPYDTLLDRFEPGMRSAELDGLFSDLRTWLPSLVSQVRERQAGEVVLVPQGPFPIEAQRRLNLEMMRRLGFDFEAGRLDESTHPFSGGVPEDVRLTTRYQLDDLMQSLLGTIHETGHARYEQNLPWAWITQPVARARSFGLHESQSLSFEMQLARHPAFLQQLAPLLVEHFGAQPAFEPGNLQRLLTRVHPGHIRVDADELTYPAHVILRYEIERDLIEGRLQARDIPAVWDESMRTLLGLSTLGNERDGPMQDVHWPSGYFGYFPCYTLGAMYSAQWFAAMRRERPDLDAVLARGDLQPVFDWLGERIWSQGSRWETAELAQRASGARLDPAHFRAHLERRYLSEN